MQSSAEQGIKTENLAHATSMLCCAFVYYWHKYEINFISWQFHKHIAHRVINWRGDGVVKDSKKKYFGDEIACQDSCYDMTIDQPNSNHTTI